MKKLIDISTSILMMLSNLALGILFFDLLIVIIDNGKIGEVAMVLIIVVLISPILILLSLLKIYLTKWIGLTKRSKQIIIWQLIVSIIYGFTIVNDSIGLFLTVLIMCGLTVILLVYDLIGVPRENDSKLKNESIQN